MSIRHIRQGPIEGNIVVEFDEPKRSIILSPEEARMLWRRLINPRWRFNEEYITDEEFKECSALNCYNFHVEFAQGVWRNNIEKGIL